MNDRRASTALLVVAQLCIHANVRGGDIAAPGAPSGEANEKVAYDAPLNCPDASAFIERVHARTQHGELAQPVDVARFSVIVSSTESASSAHIRVDGPDGQVVSRTVSGQTCDEVVSAAALITALAIEATLGGASAPRPERSEPAPAQETPSSTTGARSSWLRGWGVGGLADLESWTPAGSFGWGVFGELIARAPFDCIRLALRATTGSTSVDARSASFDSVMARLSLCPVFLRISEPLALVPCASFDAGRLAATGRASAELSTPRSAAIPWLAAEAGVSLRWQVGAPFAVDVGGEVGFPLIRHRFVFEWPTQVVYEVPAVGAGAHAAIVVTFR